MQSSDSRRVAHPANAHPAKLGVDAKAGTVKAEATPYPWRLHSSQALSEEVEAAACPWRAQPRRKQKVGVEAGQRLVSNTEAMVMEAAS